MKKLFIILSMSVLLGCQQLQNAIMPEVFEPVPKSLEVAPNELEYKLSALDEIEIFIWRSPELSSKVSVRPDGRISIPLIEDLMAAGKTPTSLAREIEQVLSTYVKDPLATVVVSGFNGSLDQQVRIIGQTKIPASIPYSAGMTLLDVMIKVGGLMEYADGNAATLSRNIDGKRKTYSLKLDDLIRDGDIEHNAPLIPGDVIIIPEAVF